MKNYILSIDQSTSATKAIIVDKSSKVIAKASVEHKQYYPREGYVEHDPLEIYENLLNVLASSLGKAGITYDDLMALAISNQRETVVVWDKTTGLPICNAIVWQCGRAEGVCADIGVNGYSEIIKKKTGLILSPYFSASKIKWVIDNVDGAAEKLAEGRLLCGTIDSWLIWKLTNGKEHCTDYSNASRTQLFNINELRWDEEILDIFGVPLSMLPTVKCSDEIFGHWNGVPITGVLGDSHGAFFAQNCFSEGMAKATFGTGSSVMVNIGDKPLESANGIVTSVGFKIKEKVAYVFEGNINSAGATVKWISEGLEMTSVPAAKKLAQSVDSSLGVYIVPAFTGLGAPYWDSDARGIITGLTLGAKKAHIVRAGIESIAYQIKAVIDEMLKANESLELLELRVDGGPTDNEFLMQFQADMIGAPVVINEVSELSPLGSAFAAGLATGFWSGLDEITSLRCVKEEFAPAMEKDERSTLFDGWNKAVRKARCN